MMFHDLTAKKSVPVLGMLVGLAAAITIFLYSNDTFNIVERTIDFAERAQSSALFSLFYNPPWAEQNSASVALADGDAQGIPVLLYHGTPPEGNDNPPLPQNVFIDQMRALKADGWQTVTMQQFTDFMKNGTPLPKKSFLLTFDDGRKESFYPVDPVLESLNYHAIMFVITGFSLPAQGGKSAYYLDKSELQYMIDTGRWELESHGDQDHRLYDVPSASTTAEGVATIKEEHFLSNKFWLEGPGRIETTPEYTARIGGDLENSKNILQSTFGISVSAFAFPFNDYGQASSNFPDAQDVVAQQVQNNYTFGMYQVDPAREDPFNYPDPNTYMIKRIEPTASLSGQDLVNLLDGADAKELPYAPKKFTNEWNSNWGNASVSPQGTLELRANPATSGAASLLDGSAWWKDYSLSATVSWNEGDALSLIARYQSDSKPFLSCAFLSDKIEIQAHNSGQTTVLESSAYEIKNKSNFEIGMSVSGNTVSCSAGGVTARAAADGAFNHPGSAGVQIWGSNLGAESADVLGISASPLLSV